MSRRVYLPLNQRELATLVAEQRLPGPRPAYAVTEALRAAWPDGDDEGWEYVAMTAAGEASWQLRDQADPARRVVVAADVGAVEEVEGDHPTEVRVAHDVVWRNVASAHIDTDDVSAGQVAEGRAPDLAWFATQEIADLVGAAGGLNPHHE